MSDSHHYTFDFYDTLISINTVDEMKRFLKDLCTPKELEDMQERWRVCQLLQKGDLSYRDIHKITNASLTTIGRVARFLKDEPYQGYNTVIQKLKKGNLK